MCVCVWMCAILHNTHLCVCMHVCVSECMHDSVWETCAHYTVSMCVCVHEREH